MPRSVAVVCKALFGGWGLGISSAVIWTIVLLTGLASVSANYASLGGTSTATVLLSVMTSLVAVMTGISLSRFASIARQAKLPRYRSTLLRAGGAAAVIIVLAPCAGLLGLHGTWPQASVLAAAASASLLAALLLSGAMRRRLHLAAVLLSGAWTPAPAGLLAHRSAPNHAVRAFLGEPYVAVSIPRRAAQLTLLLAIFLTGPVLLFLVDRHLHGWTGVRQALRLSWRPCLLISCFAAYAAFLGRAHHLARSDADLCELTLLPLPGDMRTQWRRLYGVMAKALLVLPVSVALSVLLAAWLDPAPAHSVLTLTCAIGYGALISSVQLPWLQRLWSLGTIERRWQSAFFSYFLLPLSQSFLWFTLLEGPLSGRPLAWARVLVLVLVGITSALIAGYMCISIRRLLIGPLAVVEFVRR